MNAGEHTYGARLLLPLLCFSVPSPRTPLPLFPSCATTKERRRRRQRQRQKHDRSKSSTGKRGGRRKGEMLLSCTYVLRTLPPLPLCRKPSLFPPYIFAFCPLLFPGLQRRDTLSLLHFACPPCSWVWVRSGFWGGEGRGQRSRMRLLKHNNGTDGRTDGNPLLPLHSSCRERRGAFIPSSSSLLRV